MSSAVPKLAHLPGPSAHLRRLQRDLAAGRSCLWLLPDPIVECGDAAVLMQVLLGGLETDRTDVLIVAAPRDVPGPIVRTRSGELKPDVTAALPPEGDPFDLGLTVPGFGRVTRRSPACRGPASPVSEGLVARLPPEDDDDATLSVAATTDQVLAIRAWLEPFVGEVAAIAHRLPALAKAAGKAPGTSGRVLIVARYRDVPPGLIDTFHRDPGTAVHWWWGAVSLADTLAIAWERVLMSDAGHDFLLWALRTEVIAEIVGPNLSLALDLTSAWDGARASLGPLLARLVPSDDSADSVAAGLRYGRDRPPPALTAAWAAGNIELWDNRGRWMWPRPSDAGIHDAVWAAQLRVLLPAIELARQRLADEFVAAGASPDLRTMEIGPMRRAALQNPLRQPTRVQHQRLNRLLSARNNLAHRTALDDDQIEQLCRVLRQ